MHNPIMMSWSHGLIKFSQIGVSLVAVGRGGAEKPASGLKKRLVRCQTKGGKILPRGWLYNQSAAATSQVFSHATLNDSLLIL